MADKVKIPARVFNGLEAVRLSGRTNMLDRPAVAAIALELGHVDAAIWLTDRDNFKAYAEGIFRGFEETKTPTP